MELFKQSNMTDSESGFTLVEVIVSLLLLALVGVLVCGALIEASTASAKNSMRGTATQLLTKEIDRIRTNVVTCSRLTSLLSGNFGRSSTTTADGKQLISSVRLIGTADCSTTSVAAVLEVSILNGSTVEAKATSAFEVSPD
jgi:prepilin-type N-terminal cleavage/methylation domain-containing protein